MNTIQAVAAPVAPRADGTIDLNETARATMEAVVCAVMDEQASELGITSNG